MVLETVNYYVKNMLSEKIINIIYRNITLFNYVGLIKYIYVRFVL